MRTILSFSSDVRAWLATKLDRSQSDFTYLQCLILLAFGLAYALIIPPGHAPDEGAHFLRARLMAQGQFVYEAGDLETWAAVNFSPVPYVPFAIIIKLITQTAGTSTDVLRWSLYLGRVFSLLLFITLLFVSFRLFPHTSSSLFWVAITPMALSQASVISVDYMVFGAGALLISTALAHVRARIYAWCIILSAFSLLLSKPPYAPLLLIPIISFFCIKGEQGKKRAVKALSLSLAIAVALGGALIWNNIVYENYHLPGGLLDTLNQQIGDFEIDPGVQFIYAVKHPMYFFYLIINTALRGGRNLYYQFVGILGWLDTPIPFWAAVVWGVFTPIAILTAGAPKHLSSKSPQLLGGGCIIAGLLASVLVFLGSFMAVTPIGFQIILGLQGRHFHIIFVAFFVGLALLNPFKLPQKYHWAARWLLLVMAVIINSAAVVTIVQKYGN